MKCDGSKYSIKQTIKRIAACCLACLCLLLHSCRDHPAAQELIGKWKNKDGAEIVLHNDGSFELKSFPTVLLYFTNQRHPNQVFDGSGKWEVVDKSSRPEVQINLLETSFHESGIGITLLIAGSGLLENKRPWKTLFLWIGEEGDERYEFVKQ